MTDPYDYKGNYPRRKHRSWTKGVGFAYGVSPHSVANWRRGDDRYRLIDAAYRLGPIRCCRGKKGWLLDGAPATPQDIYDAADRVTNRY